MKRKTYEFNEIIKDKDNCINELEYKLRNLTNDSSNHIKKLNNTI